MIKFSVNHWSTEFYPSEEPFYTWMSDDHFDEYLMNHKFVEENRLVVAYTHVDMSLSFAVICPEEFVDSYAPCLKEERNKEFIFTEEDEWGLIEIKFQEYSEDNIGIWYYDKEDNRFIKTYSNENNKFCFLDD